MVAEHVAVTGGSGYVGQHLVRRLIAEGWRVSALMRRPPASAVPAVDVVLADVTEYATLEPHFRGVDAVIHLACLPINPSGADPRQAFQTNALGSFNVLEACHRHGVGRAVVASTAYVYGNPLTDPMAETHPTFPTNPYGASKLAGDAFTLAYAEWCRLTTVVLRLFNVFGPAADGQPRGTVEALFAERARAGLPVTVRGNPDDARDFVHIDDVVDALASALSRRASGVYNIGSGKAYTLRDLAKAAGVGDDQIEYDGLEIDRPPAVVRADISQARRDLDFRPGTDVLDYVAGLALSADPAP